jgi:hypothetical protein
VKLPNLIVAVGDNCDRAEHSFCNGRLAVSVECGKNLFPDLRRKTLQAQDLCYPGAGDPLPEGNFGLTCDLPGFQESFPLVGFSEEFDYSGGLRFPWRSWITPARRDSTYRQPRRCPSPQVADVAVFAVGRHRAATLANRGEMNDPEVDLRLDPFRAGSQSVTDGEPALSMPTEEDSFVGIFFLTDGASPVLARCSRSRVLDA